MKNNFYFFNALFFPQKLLSFDHNVYGTRLLLHNASEEESL